jgi:uncharacterized OsmC-like protein
MNTTHKTATLRRTKPPLSESHSPAEEPARQTRRSFGCKRGSSQAVGDLLLGALAACAQLTCQMVAASTRIPVEDVQVTVEGDLDLSGTLGLSREAKVGFESIRVRFDFTAPEASDEQLAALREKTERYCVVLQTLLDPPQVETMVA